VPLGERYAVSVQPWLDGRAGRFGDRLDDADAVALVGLLAALHGIPAGRTGAVVEDPSVPGRAALEGVLDAVRQGRAPHVTGPLGPVVLEALRRRGPAVRRALDAVDATPTGPAELVPTHGEPHPGNVVRTPEGPVLVDWETARLAEPERDLWLVAGRSDLDVAGVYAEQSGHPVDAGRLAARARRWALTDVADFVPTLLAATEETPDTAWQVEALLGTLEEL
jgi:aminoglycoside phosphotransferase (APT) family kinase protein